MTPEGGEPLTIEGTPQPWKGSPGGVWVFGDLPWPAQAPVPFRFFSPSSFWNAPLAPDAPLDPSSAALSAELRDMAMQEVAAGIGPWIETNGTTTPLYTVPADQPTVRVELETAPSAGATSLQAAFEAVPIPPGARPATGTEGQMTIWQPVHRQAVGVLAGPQGRAGQLAGRLWRRDAKRLAKPRLLHL